MMVKSESIVVATRIAGLLAGVFLGYKMGTRNNSHPHYTYEFKDVEDYGDEEEDYDVFSHNIIDGSMNEDELSDDFRPVMRAEPLNYEG